MIFGGRNAILVF